MVGIASAPLLLASCGRPTANPASGVDRGVVLVNLASEVGLVAAYDQAIALRPDVATTLQAIRDQHAQHAATLRERLGSSPPAPSPSPTSAPADVLAALREAERSAARERATTSTQAEGADLISLLSLIGASEAQHVAVLAGTP